MRLGFFFFRTYAKVIRIDRRFNDQVRTTDRDAHPLRAVVFQPVSPDLWRAGGNGDFAPYGLLTTEVQGYGLPEMIGKDQKIAKPYRAIAIQIEPRIIPLVGLAQSKLRVNR